MENQIRMLEEFFIELINNELENLATNNSENDNIIKKKATAEFKIQLETLIDVNDKICSICQDTINIDEECIKLPCKDSSHFFHKNDNTTCGGIMKWLDINNSCPCCRYEFPYEEYKDVDNVDNVDLRFDNQILNIINIEADIEDNDIQRAIELSLQDIR